MSVGSGWVWVGSGSLVWVGSVEVLAPVLDAVNIPSYMTSGAVVGTGAGVAGAGRTVQFYITQDDPYAAATVVNQQLRNL